MTNDNILLLLISVCVIVSHSTGPSSPPGRGRPLVTDTNTQISNPLNIFCHLNIFSFCQGCPAQAIWSAVESFSSRIL